MANGNPISVSMIEFRARRLRVFVFDAATGDPLPGVRVHARGVLAASESANAQERTFGLGILQSDHVGYLSFDFGTFGGRRDEITHVWVGPVHDPNAEIDVWPVLAQEPAIVELKLLAKPGRPCACKKCRAKPSLPSVPTPDTIDWQLSPASFASRAQALVGEDGCEDLFQSSVAVQTYVIPEIIRLPTERETRVSARPRTLCDDMRPLVTPLPCVRYGLLVEYEVTWNPRGHALGEIAYSLPLAPCEQVNLAVIDWARTSETSRDEATSQADQLVHNQRRDRLVEETVRAAVRERQSGGSLMGGIGAATGSLGGSFSTTTGSRRISADSAQDVADTIAQASTLVRQFRSTVVVQASQAEGEVLQTRTVTNHNHCHALTILYYEVVREYLVTVTPSTRPLLLVQFPLVEFADDSILRHRRILEAVLTEQRIRAGFDAVEKRYQATLAFDPALVTLEADDYELSEVRLRVKTAGIVAPGEIKVSLFTKPEATVSRGVEIPGVEIHGTFPDEGEIARLGANNPGDETFFTIRFSPVRWGSVGSLRIYFTAFQSAWTIAHVFCTTEARGVVWVVFPDAPGATIRGTRGDFHDFIVRPPGGERTPDLVLSAAERFARQQLLDHLASNAVYYSRAVALAEDADARTVLFEGCELNGQRLGDLIEHRAVGTSGDFLAFPLLEDRHKLDIPGSIDRPAERWISLPTRGVFAEAKLSHCNACEERDTTRFWDWKESPCSESAPAITGVQPGSRARDVSVSPTSMSESGVNIESPPDAPAPGGLAAVLDVLSSSDLFRNMSGSPELAGLLTSLANGAVELEKAKLEAGVAIERIKHGETAGRGGGASAQGGTGGGGASPAPSGSGNGQRTPMPQQSAGSQPRPSAAEQLAQIQTYDRAAGHGSITEDQRSALSYDYLQQAQFRPSRETGPGQVSGEQGLDSVGAGSYWLSGTILFANFDVNSDALKPEYQRELDHFAELCSIFPEHRIDWIQGRASPTGLESNNGPLSQSRASAVRDYLISRGVEADLIGSAAGLGSTHPLSPSGTPPGEIDVERSVLLQFAVLVAIPPPPPRLRQRTPPSPATQEWAITLRITAGLHHLGGVQVYEGLLRHCDTGEVRRIRFAGVGVGGGLSITPSVSEIHWETFITTSPATFSDFDGALATFDGVHLGVGMGGAIIFLRFPSLVTERIKIAEVIGMIGFEGSLDVGSTWVRDTTEYFEHTPCLFDI